MAVLVQEETVKSNIMALLDDLPPESLVVVRQFVEFLRQQAQQGQPVVSVAVEEPRPPYLYPTVPVPFSVFEGLTHILEEGYEGDALADTEALYDGD